MADVVSDPPCFSHNSATDVRKLATPSSAWADAAPCAKRWFNPSEPSPRFTWEVTITGGNVAHLDPRRKADGFEFLIQEKVSITPRRQLRVEIFLALLRRRRREVDSGGRNAVD